MKTLIQFLFVLFFAVQSYAAASVRLYFIDPFTGSKDTNVFYITAIGTNVLSNGGVVSKGVPQKVTPAADGNATNTLAVGHYSVTNRSLGSGIVIRVPDTSTFYDYTNLLVSGYNIFVTIENGEATSLNTNTIRILTSTNLNLLDGYIVRGGSQVIADGDWVFGGILSGDADSSWSIAADGDAEFNDLAATNIIATSLAGPVLNQLTNIAGPFGAIDPLHINIRSAHKTMAKLRSRNPIKVVNFGDDQIIPTTGIIGAFTNLVSNRRAPVVQDGSYLYRSTVGSAAEISPSATPALGLLPVAAIRMANGSSFTNVSTLVNGFATTLIPVNYYSSNGFGAFTIYTNAYGAAPVALATVSANNGGALAYSYTNFVVPLVTNLVVGVVSSGTNIIIGAGQTDTNLSTWSLDNWEAGNVKLADFTASTTISNMARSFWASNDFDFVVIHDINGTDGTTASNEWYSAQSQFEVALTNSGVIADIFYFTPTPITNAASSAVGVAQRLGMIVACREFNRGMFDSYRMTFPYNVANSLSYYNADGLHLNSVASDYLMAQFFDEIGLTPDVLRIYGSTSASTLRTNAVDYASWNMQANQGGSGIMSASNYWSSGRVGFSFSGSGLVGEYNIAGNQSLTALRGTNGTYLIGVNKGDGLSGEFGRFTGQGGLILYPSGGGGINNFEPGAGGISISGGFTNYGTGNTSHIKGGARIDGTLATAQITTTNFIALFTNYTAANFAPVAGQIKLVASNSIIYAVSQVSTNPLW